jgi:hypothetical protein
MQNKPTIAFFAMALALAHLPALAAGMPPDGSKNFSPPSGTPSFFTNENIPVSGRVADTTAVFDSADDQAAAAVRSEVGYATSVHTHRGGHSRFVAAHASIRHSLRFAAAKSSPAAKTEAAVRTKTVGHGKLGGWHAASHRG